MRREVIDNPPKIDKDQFWEAVQLLPELVRDRKIYDLYSLALRHKKFKDLYAEAKASFAYTKKGLCLWFALSGLSSTAGGYANGKVFISQENLDILEKKLQEMKEGNYMPIKMHEKEANRVAATNKWLETRKIELGSRRAELVEIILGYVEKNPGTSTKDLIDGSECGYTFIHREIKLLIKNGLIRRERIGRNVKYFIAESEIKD